MQLLCVSFQFRFRFSFRRDFIFVVVSFRRVPFVATFCCRFISISLLFTCLYFFSEKKRERVSDRMRELGNDMHVCIHIIYTQCIYHTVCILTRTHYYDAYVHTYIHGTYIFIQCDAMLHACTQCHAWMHTLCQCHCTAAMLYFKYDM